MEKTYLITLTTTDLETLVFSCIDQAFKLNVRAEKQSEKQEKLISPAETCQQFYPPISKNTLARWTKDGRLKDYRIGGRVYYKQGEVLEAVKHLQRYKK